MTNKLKHVSSTQPQGSENVRKCSFEGCVKPSRAKGLCKAHREQQKAGKELSPLQSLKYGSGCTHRGYIYHYVDGKQVAAHRHTMEQHLGRPLVEGENVHHINGDRSDNRIENLELWSTSQPSGQRVEDKLSWARDIIKLYGKALEKEAACISEAEEILEKEGTTIITTRSGEDNQ